MAYTDTLLQDAIYKASKKDTFQSRELRGSNYGALDAAVAQNSLILPKSTIESIKNSSVQATKVDVIKKEAQGAGTARKCAGTGSGVSARSTLTWSTIVEEFSMSYLEMAQNDYSYEELFQIRLEQKLINLYKRMDAAVVAALEANYSAGNGDSFTLFNDAFQVPLNQYDIATTRAATWFNKVKADMMKNDFDPDMLHVVGEANLKAVFSNMLNQGQYTDTNLGFQFQGTTSSFTNRVSNNTGIYATGYAFEKGAFGFLTWTNKLSREGKDIGTDLWRSFNDPRYGFNIELKIKKACADNSGTITGAEADFTEGFVLAVDVCTPIAYTSDSNTGIYKYELNEDSTVQSGSGSYV